MSTAELFQERPWVAVTEVEMQYQQTLITVVMWHQLMTACLPDLYTEMVSVSGNENWTGHTGFVEAKTQITHSD